MTESSDNLPVTVTSTSHNEIVSSFPLSIPSPSPSKPRVSLRESLPTYLYTPTNKTYEYRAEDDLEGEAAPYSRNRRSSIGPTLTRDPIAPGIYTRVRKRSLTPLDEAQCGSPDLLIPKDPISVSTLPPVSQPYMPDVQTMATSMPITKAILSSKIHEEDALSEKGTGLPIIQEFILDSQFRITIEGRQWNRWKAMLYCILCIVSGGIVFLLSKWFPRIRSKLTTSQSALAHSSHIYVKNSFNQSDLVSVRRSHYGKLLTHIFGSQKLHECLVVDEKEGAYLRKETCASPEPSPILRVIAEEEGVNSVNEETLIYTHDEPINPLQHAPAQHASVEDSSSFSPSLLEKKQGTKPSPSDFLYFFEYRCIRFIYHPNLGRYFENSQWESFQSTDYTKLTEGITDSTATQRSVIYGENLINIQRKSIFRLFIDEVLHPFNVFQIFSIILWCNETYYVYATAIFLISSYTIILTIYETRKNLANLIEMSRFRCALRIFRDGKWSLQSSTNLVPGDIFEPHLEMTSTMPCDALLLEGDCIMNESMLTGESLPVSKAPLEEELWDKSNKEAGDSHRLALSSDKSILFAGTKLVRVRGVQDQPARAVAIRTGFNTTKGHLIRNILFQRPINFKFYRDAIRFVYILAAIAGAGFSLTLYSFISRSVELSLVFLRALDLITVVIPPALPASMAIGVTFAMSRLKRKNIYCISPPRINICGKVNMFCFDKTGTLTEEGLDLLGAHILVPETKTMGPMLDSMQTIMKQVERENSVTRSLYQSVKPPTVLPMAQLMIVGMATCHSVKSVDDGSLIGDPLDVKMFQFTGWKLEDSGYSNEGSLTIAVKPPLTPSSVSSTVNVPTPDKPLHLPELGIIRCFEFVAALRRMSVLVKVYQGFGMSAFVKGAPESIRDICTASSLPANFDQILTHYTSSGYRVIALATKSFPTLNWARAQKLKREEVETDLIFLGFLVFENRLKPVTKDVIHVLTNAKFRTTISTGDNILTAMSVAKECKIVSAHATVFLPRLLSSAVTEPGAMNIVWESASQPLEQLCPFSLRPISLTTSDYTIGCTGHILEYLIDHCSTDILYQVLMKCEVYARMNPDQKQRLVECFQKLEYCVGFCGDGANDCGALKSADVGLSLSEAEASIAAPFTSKITDIRCTIDLVLEGRSALVTSFSCFKFMALYSLIQLTTVSLLYYFITNLSDGQYIYIDLFVIIPLAICFGRLKSNPQITSKRPTANLVSKKVLCSIIGQIVTHIGFQVAVFFTTLSRSWYQGFPGDEGIHGHTPTQINTILFIFTTFQYLIVAFIFTSNAPFQKSIIVNAMFMITAIAILLLNLVFLLFPPDWLVDLLSMTDEIPNSFKMFLLALVLANCIVAYFTEICCYKVLQFISKYRKKRPKKQIKLFKKLLIAQSLASSFGEPEKVV